MPHSDESMFPAADDSMTQSPNWLVGVIDDPRKAEDAERDLRSAGFPERDVLLLHSEEALSRLRAKDDQRGPLGWLMKAVSVMAADTSEFEGNYAAEARAGHSILSLKVSDEDEIEWPARSILMAFDAHYIKHYGMWAVTDLTADPGGVQLDPDGPPNPSAR